MGLRMLIGKLNYPFVKTISVRTPPRNSWDDRRNQESSERSHRYTVSSELIEVIKVLRSFIDFGSYWIQIGWRYFASSIIFVSLPHSVKRKNRLYYNYNRTFCKLIINYKRQF